MYKGQKWQCNCEYGYIVLVLVPSTVQYWEAIAAVAFRQSACVSGFNTRRLKNVATCHLAGLLLHGQIFKISRQPHAMRSSSSTHPTSRLSPPSGSFHHSQRGKIVILQSIWRLLRSPILVETGWRRRFGRRFPKVVTAISWLRNRSQVTVSSGLKGGTAPKVNRLRQSSTSVSCLAQFRPVSEVP